MKRKLKAVAIAATVLVASWFGLDRALVADQPECEAERLAAALPADTTLTKVKARWFPEQHCLVKGYVTTADPGPNRVNFIVQLPEKKSWNGRYFFIGLGGGAGRTPKISESPFGNPLVAGFAVAGTDTGHQAFLMNPLDWSFLTDRAKTIDHIHRGGHVSAVASQAISKAYYGVDSMYRYHSGCSGGGRMGVMAAIHHPGDFDGYLIGAPGITSANILNFIWIAQHMERLPGGKFDKEKLLVLEREVISHCDADDGAVDHMVWDITQCRYDPAALLCGKAVDDKAGACFTETEIDVIEALLDGPQSPRGQVYPGLSPANPSGWRVFLNTAASVIANAFTEVYFGEDFDLKTDFDFGRQEDIDAWWAAVNENGYGTRASADYSGVSESGGKIIFWHGVSDPAISVLDQIVYYDEIRAVAGGDANLQRFARMYLVPGLFHCFGGPGPSDAPDQLLRALIDWVEHERPPGPVVAKRGTAQRYFQGQGIYRFLPDPADYIDTPPEGTAPREFLLCPYPQRARPSGSALASSAPQEALYDARSWRCEPAQATHRERRIP